ncbi:MAG TPA: Gfo/Idh/MocA family oxidoreductase [Tepidisphaeraceae bacterium]|jgi:predicted dehydrogenase
MASRVRVAIVGLGFGAEFIPIYQNHPDAEMYAVCQRNPKTLEQIGQAFGVKQRYSKYEDLLKDPNVDVVHINTPIPDHAPMTIAALKAGKHVACTVPMATTVDECAAIVKEARKQKKNYMMMETVVYSREFIFVKKMFDSGQMGRLQFMRGSHQQEMAGWPGYWEGLPPMYYATHCVGPLLAMADKLAESVQCLGSGQIAENLVKKYGSPFALESAHIRLRNSAVGAEVTRSLFETARQYRESFDIYCDKVSFEWSQIEHEQAVLHRGETPERVTVPDFANLLPEGIRRYTTKGVYDSDANVHLSFKQGSGHGGSHPHLAHEFLRSIVENRKPWVDEQKSANWTSTGICAHQSAMNGGEKVIVPAFD